VLAVGTILGPYKILSMLGAGGMGEVYRSRDARLERDVAIKVIPASFARDPDRLARFEQEARAAGALNHPNIVAIHDIGEHEGAPFVVMELLEGESLRERLRQGPVPVRKAIDYAAQVARGLAAAHAKGIVHRDLKPENLYITRDGRVKVLDFGLAKLARPGIVGPGGGETVSTVLTGSGVVLGTVGYMAPEQVRGQEVDHRADLFALGTILHEMLTGERAFKGASSIETLNAILNEEPAPLSASGREIPPAVELIVRHCLEKGPDERYQSARDLAFALEGQSGISGISGLGIPTAGAKQARVWQRPGVVATGTLAAVLAASAATFLWTRHAVERPAPTYTRITFQRGNVEPARFTPDGKSVVYSATWGDKPREVFSQRVGATDARPLGLIGAQVVATAGSEMAVILANRTLARVPLDGGTPREVAESVFTADWSRDGARFLVVRFVAGMIRLECPPGKVLIERPSQQWIGGARFSPRGDLIAFHDNKSFQGTASDDLVVMDLSGKRTIISNGWIVGAGGYSWSPYSKTWEQVGTLAWSPDGREVWIAGRRPGGVQGLYAVSLSGKVRLMARLPGGFCLQDIAPDGRVLLTMQQHRFETRGRMAGDSTERNLSWLDDSYMALPSDDGTRLVLQDGGTYFWRMDGSQPVRLADSGPCSVSPDWKWVTCDNERRGLKLVPVGAGETKVLPMGSLADIHWGWWHADGKRLFIQGAEAGKLAQTYIQELPDGLPRPPNPEDVTELGDLSPDGHLVVGGPPGGGVDRVLYPVAGGDPLPIPGLDPYDTVIGWNEGSRSLFVTEGTRFSSGVGGMPARVMRVDFQTGRRDLWLELAPPDRAGVTRIEGVRITRNGRYYTYSYPRDLTDLYCVEGLK
jgi:eukaryotic-like serine/threonine-protein kinase